MSGRLYTVVFDNVTVAAAQDFFEITCADDKPIQIHGLFIGQSSQEGDAFEDFWRWQVITGHATSGSGGSQPTPQPLKLNDAAAGFTVEVNNTTIASAGTASIKHSDVFNIRAGLPFWWTPECRPMGSQASLTVVRLLSTPDASTITSATLYVEEMI